MFSAWSLKSKVMLAFTGISLGLLAVGATGTITIARVAGQYRTIPAQDVPNIVLVADMRSKAWELRVFANRLRASIAHQTPEAAAEQKEIEHQMDEAVVSYSKMAKAYDEIPSRPDEEKQFDITQKEWADVLKDLKDLRLIAAAEQPNISEFDKVFTKHYRASANDHIQSLADLALAHKKGAEQAAMTAEQNATFGNWLSAVVVIVGFTSAIVTGFVFSSSLTKTLSLLSERLKGGAESVAGESQKIAASSSQLSASTTEQAAALQETVSSVDEVSAMINKNADNAKQSQEVAGLSENSASKGRDAVTGLIGSIDEISKSNAEIMSQIEDSNRQMSEIVKVIAEIGNKTKVINDIVFQTKLLSFNASVEAARAGEHGKGFAVVAEEVGNLAQMSGNAAKEISQMLEESSHRVEGIVSETKNKIDRLVVVGREKLADGTSRARSCGDILEEIVGNVSQVGQLMTEIATASREQSQGVQEITRAMAQLDQVTQQNAVASQDSANASEQLSNQAEELRAIIDELNRTVAGAKDGQPVQSVPAKHVAKNKAAKAKTLEFKKPAKSSAPAPKKSIMKKASGDDSFPDENDPRFEDV